MEIDLSEQEYGALVTKTVGVMCDSWPRQVFSKAGTQVPATSWHDAADTLEDTSMSMVDGYYSVYSFPEGHSKHGNNPRVDTLFLDFDLPGDHIYNITEDPDDWVDAMNGLLSTIEKVTMHLYMQGAIDYYRVVLSGHKGVHLYLDFPPIDPEVASQDQFKAGLNDMVDYLMDRWEDQAPEVRRYLDADSADLGRLGRMPNTIHPKASEIHGEPRFAVPLTPEESIDLDAETYAELTRQPRLPDAFERSENAKARVAVRQRIFDAMTQGVDRNSDGRVTSMGGSFDPSRVKAYKQRHDGKYDSVDDIWFKINKPCIRQYYQSDDQFDHGQASHWMELFVMTHLVNEEIPYEVCVEFFEGMDGFDRQETMVRLNQIIGRGYSKMSCERLWESAPQFCVGGDCDLYDDEEGCSVNR